MAQSKQKRTELKSSEFGKLVMLYRQQRGWTQGQLAEKWGYTREYVSQIERGKRKLDKQEQVNKLADILEIPSERLEAVGKGISLREVVAQTPAEADDVLFQTLLDSSLATVKLSWLIWYADQNTTVVENLETLIARLEDASTKYRGTFLRPAQQILAYAYEMKGKMAFDHLHYREASGYFHEMQVLGEELRNADLMALAMTHQSDVLRKRGLYEAAIRYLEAARPYAETASPSVKGLRLLILARAHAAYGASSSFLRAIDEAQELVTETREDLDSLSNQFSLVEVLQERAQGYTFLWKPQMALDIYQETDVLRPFRPLRDLGSYTIVKAQAHAYNDDLDQGVAYAVRGLELATQYKSQRHVSRVQGMYDRLNVTPRGKHPRMRDLQDALHQAHKKI